MSLFYRLPSYQNYHNRVSQKAFFEEIKVTFEGKFQQSVAQIEKLNATVDELLDTQAQETLALSVKMLAEGYAEAESKVAVFMVKNHLATQLAKLSLKTQGRLDFLLKSLDKSHKKSQATLAHYHKIYKFIDVKYRHKTDAQFQAHYESLQASLPENMDTLLSNEYKLAQFAGLANRFKAVYYEAIEKVTPPQIDGDQALDSIDLTPFSKEGTAHPDYGYANLNQHRLEALIAKKAEEKAEQPLIPIRSSVDLEKTLQVQLAADEVKVPIENTVVATPEQEAHNSLLTSAKTFLRASMQKTFDSVNQMLPGLSKDKYEELRGIVDELESEYQFEELPPMPTVDESFMKVDNFSAYKGYAKPTIDQTLDAQKPTSKEKPNVSTPKTKKNTSNNQR